MKKSTYWTTITVISMLIYWGWLIVAVYGILTKGDRSAVCIALSHGMEAALTYSVAMMTKRGLI